MSGYLDIGITLTELSDGSFDIVARSPAGEARSRFRPPFTLAEVTPSLAVPGIRRGAVASDGDAAPVPVFTPSELGTRLFDALFTGAIRDNLLRTEGMAAAGAGVRIRLKFDLRANGSAAVAALPWELLRKPDETSPMLVSTQTVLVRSLDVNKAILPRALVPPLRVLLIRSNPKGTAALDLGHEGNLIVESLRRIGGIVVDEVDAVENRIRAQLRRADYHVVHYMGHGDVAGTGGLLLLEDEAGNPVPTSALAFANMLRDEPLRLVFLNACDTGSNPQSGGMHPFAGVAAAVVAEGVPAVVAMQFPISDRAALRFSEAFYQCVAEGAAMDVAVAEGRRVLYQDAVRTANSDDGSCEWATPVLYLRADSGDLLANRPTPPVAAEPPEPPPPAPPPAPAPAPPRLSIWKRQNGLTWALSGALTVVVGFVVWAVNSEPEPVQQSEVAVAETRPADRCTDFSGELNEVCQVIEQIPEKAWINDGASQDSSLVDQSLDASLPALRENRELRAATLRQLADGGSPKAAYLIGLVLNNTSNDGVEYNRVLANKYFNQAANGGIAAAMASLAHNHLQGDGAEYDLATAREWLSKARENCNSWDFSMHPGFGFDEFPVPASCNQ